ncbi:MAG: hypothetical protein K0V04_09765 [Deltaproteobacteria bacterium]|nr:hypothetical protein [Deltaproteobacteria bacterium]
MSGLRRPLTIVTACLMLSLSACDDGKGKADAKKADAKKADAKKADAKAGDAKKADAKQADAKQADAKAPAGAPVLTLGAAKLMQENKPDEVLELLADGGIALSGKPMARLSTDGKLTGPDGKVTLVVGPDGKVTAGGKPTGLELSDGGATVTMGGKTTKVTFGEDGSITVEPDSGNGPKMKHEGCTGPIAKNCGLVLFGMLMSDGEEAAEAGGPPSQVEAEPPRAPAKKADG